jgi:hypothetical protein
MSYVLTAVFGRPATIDDLVHPLLARSITLGAGFVMRPVVERDDDQDIPFDPLDLDALDDAFGPLFAPASIGGSIAYVHIEMFGGPADEVVAVWRDGEMVWCASGEELDERLSHEAFRMIGVEAPAGGDEFDALGLGRHRETEAWLGEP